MCKSNFVFSVLLNNFMNYNKFRNLYDYFRCINEKAALHNKIGNCFEQFLMELNEDSIYIGFCSPVFILFDSVLSSGENAKGESNEHKEIDWNSRLWKKKVCFFLLFFCSACSTSNARGQRWHELVSRWCSTATVFTIIIYNRSCVDCQSI